MNYQSTLAAIDKRLPGQAVFRATYRTAFLTETAWQLEKEFQPYREPPHDFHFKKHALNSTYTFSFHRGWTSGFSLGLVTSKDREGQPVVLGVVSRSSKLRMTALIISLVLMFPVAILAIIGFQAWAPAMLPGAQGVLYVFFFVFAILACYYLSQPFVTMFESRAGGRLPDETMNEVVAKFREIVERKCTLVSE